MTTVYRAPIDRARALGVRYFASGSNHPGEILGLASAGIDVGVAVHELHSDGVAVIAAMLAEYPLTRVFVDSGAFSEVSFPSGVPTISRPISDAEWRRRLAVYLELAVVMGDQLYVVAPDCIAHQAETLYRMSDYAELIQAAAAYGAHILVPCQAGELELAEFWDLAVEVLGVPAHQLVAAIPMRKSATSTADYAEFVRSARLWAVHLLGLGPKSTRFDEVVASTPIDVEIMCDSVLITSLVGRTNGRGGGPRPLTAAMDDVADELADQVYALPGALDWTDASDDVASWLTAARRKDVATQLAQVGYDMRGFVRDPDAWLHAGDRRLDPVIGYELDAAWSEYVLPIPGRAKTGRGSVELRKSQGIARLFDLKLAPPRF